MEYNDAEPTNNFEEKNSEKENTPQIYVDLLDLMRMKFFIPRRLRLPQYSNFNDVCLYYFNIY